MKTRLLPMHFKLPSALLLTMILVRTAAAVTMPAIFGDHMVLQQDTELLLWGGAQPGEKIEVSVGTRQGQASANASGEWVVKLAPLPVNGQPVDVHVTGSSGSLVFHDVLIGDVWVCSGQSNMEFGIGQAFDSAEAIRQAVHPQIRLFIVEHAIAFTPQNNVKGEWLVCTPENIQKKGWVGFSAVAYFFGREIQQDRKGPIGLIESCWGGTPIHSWTSYEALHAEPALDHYAAAFVKTRDSLPQLKQDFDTNIFPTWQKADAEWQAQYGKPFQEAMAAWQLQANEAKKTGKPAPPRPVPEKPEPKKPGFVGEAPGTPTVLFNGMIHPLLRYAIKGVIWYQGEANGSSLFSGKEYATHFPDMINDWRRQWSQQTPSLRQFPFLFVQLAGWKPGVAYMYLRYSQFKTLSLPNTGMAVAIDIGEEGNIHPRDKVDVGHRLALAARRIAYGEQVVSSGPVYDSMQAVDNKIRLIFKETGGGLTIGAPLAIPPSAATTPAAGTLQGFSVAGADQKFVPAHAEITDGRTVVVSGQGVEHPVAVHYAWESFPEPPANLYNKEGLPCVPFATDFSF